MKKMILIADDNSANRRIFSDVLARDCGAPRGEEDACVFAYEDGRFEARRLSPSFARAVLGENEAPGDARALNLFDFADGENRAALIGCVRRAAADGGRASCEIRLSGLPGRAGETCLQLTVGVVAKEGERLLCEASIEDVTRDREAARRLRATAEQLKLLNDSIPGGLAVFEIRGDVVKSLYLSDGVYALTGYAREGENALPMGNALQFTFAEDAPALKKQIYALWRDDTPVDCTYRIHTADGGFKWINLRGVASARHEDALIANTVFIDVTERQIASERLRLSEEQFRIAASQGGRGMARYDINSGVYYHESEELLAQGFGCEIRDMPHPLIDAGIVAPDCVSPTLQYFEGMRRGEEHLSAAVALRVPSGAFRWYRSSATVIRGSDGAPAQAIIVYDDITEQREKEAVYRKWQQSLREKAPESYTLIRCNLSKDVPFDAAEGSLLAIRPDQDAASFAEWTQEYVKRRVDRDDRERYAAAIGADALLSDYYRGRRASAMEYRELLPDGNTRWLRLSVETVEYPNSSDVAAYLLYEDIDEVKKAELLAREMAQCDPLTGVLNRSAFAAEVDKLARNADADSHHALLMLDVDGFKQLNDTFGHAAGDQALIDITAALSGIMRGGDLLGRLGGDEFVLFLPDVPDDEAAAEKSRRINELTRKTYSADVRISVSVGIACYPRDGADFEALYHKADAALYRVKESGKDGYAFFRGTMKRRGDGARPADKPQTPPTAIRSAVKRRMLIVEDNLIDLTLLVNIFGSDFIVEQAKDGNAAMIRLRHYGTAISVVLLDLGLPGMDGFTVMEKMRESAQMQRIPVIVVSGYDERETVLKAIQGGAADFVTKPVDPSLIRLRVQSAVSKAENERLRAQNSFLTLQSDEVARYRIALDNIGMTLIEHDWRSGAFIYDAGISRYLSGRFDQRGLWHILLSDMVADVQTVRRMQLLEHEIAEDRTRTRGSMIVSLRAPTRVKRWFRFSVYKKADEFCLTEKLILSLSDLEDASFVPEV